MLVFHLVKEKMGKGLRRERGEMQMEEQQQRKSETKTGKDPDGNLVHGKNPDGYVLQWEKDARATFLAGGRAKMDETFSSILNRKQSPKKTVAKHNMGEKPRKNSFDTNSLENKRVDPQTK